MLEMLVLCATQIIYVKSSFPQINLNYLECFA